MSEFIYGLWPAMECIRAGRRSFEKLVIADHLEEKGLVGEIMATAKENNIECHQSNYLSIKYILSQVSRLIILS